MVSLLLFQFVTVKDWNHFENWQLFIHAEFCVEVLLVLLYLNK